MKFFLLKDINTREVYVSNDLEETPPNSLPFYEHHFVLAVFDKYPQPTSLVEGATENQIEELKKENIKARYELHKADGWQAYQDFRADLVNQIYKGTLTEALAFVIENYLSVAYDKIAQNGDWKTAYYKLSTTTIPQEHSFVEEYKNKALQILGKYINDNYPS